ncbi:Threonine/homoserine efflux transporter RhtA [Arthrobacter cupressi]|uniref:Threonine/homoserine efflux transporter RhtA n=1 Tax=Arthrobacter cupressi TaxID=1045773 RepID=A0A1G8Q6K6_9MICC|nr:Threonine/homoserine efflux transporter RhtA [Arthrobacter cupressi]
MTGTLLFSRHCLFEKNGLFKGHRGTGVSLNFVFAALGVLGVAASGPLIAATLAGTTATALGIAFWRNAIAAVVLASPVLIREPRQFRDITRREALWTGVAAVALAAHFACFITSLQLTSVAASTALVCLQSAWIAVFEFLRGTRHHWAVPAGLGVALGGVVVITGFDMGSSPEALWGDVLALAGGLFGALYALAGGRARQTMGTGSYTALCYGICAVLIAPLALAMGQPLVSFDAGGWLGILAITLCAQLVGHTMFNHLLATMSPLLVSMIILLEIPGAALLAAVFLREALPGGTYIGLGLILAGLAVVVGGQRNGAKGDGDRAATALGTD